MDSNHPVTTPGDNHVQLCKNDPNDPLVQHDVPFKEAISCLV